MPIVTSVAPLSPVKLSCVNCLLLLFLCARLMTPVQPQQYKRKDKKTVDAVHRSITSRC
jgi:hypothetical protein